MERKYFRDGFLRTHGDPEFLLDLFALDARTLLSKADVLWLVGEATRLLAREPNVLYLEEPLSVVGDVHGQLHDLLHVLRHAGLPPRTRFLFLGDYVDRGDAGVEVLLITLALKLAHPREVFLLRGNHESRRVTSEYGFRHECMTKYDQEVYEACMLVFQQMPLAAVVNAAFFAVHGGLSPELGSVAELAGRAKFDEDIPTSGVLCDLTWSDPTDSSPLYRFNDSRRCSVYFGPAAAAAFLREHRLLAILRAHQCVPEGFKTFCWGAAFPQVVTVFSAENYCQLRNQGAYLTLANNDLCVHQYDFALRDKRRMLPFFGDAFAASADALRLALADLCIGFLEFTNDALLDAPHAPLSDLELLLERNKQAMRLNNPALLGQIASADSVLLPFQIEDGRQLLPRRQGSFDGDAAALPCVRRSATSVEVNGKSLVIRL